MTLTPEETIDFQIRWAWHRIARLYNQEASEFGGTMSIGYILLNIDKEGTPSTHLGPKMGMEARSMSRSLKNLEDAGLVERIADTKDKRVVRVYLTAEGKKLRRTSRKVVLKFNEYLREHISKQKLNAFFDVMNEINKLLERDEISEAIALKKKKRKKK